MTKTSHPSRSDSTQTAARPTGFWHVPPDVWTDEQAMDEFAQRVCDHMTTAHEKAEVERETEES